MTESLQLLQVTIFYFISVLGFTHRVKTHHYFYSRSAVGLQMKLEYFQRKFWTACRQVDNFCSNINEDNEFQQYHAKLSYCFVLSAQLWMGSVALAVILR